MSKKYNNKNKDKNTVPVTLRRLWIVAGTALFVVLVLQTVVIVRLYERQRTDPGTWPIKSLIVAAVDNLGRPGVRDGLSGKTYIPEYRLVLPNTADAPLIKYTTGNNDSLQIASQQALNRMSSKLLGSGLNGSTGKAMQEAFDVVPGLQACSRQITIGFSEIKDSGAEFVMSKKLTDGRTAYVYRDTGCTLDDGGRFVDYIKQIDSYTPAG